MRRSFADPRLALILRRLRGRFGASAPRVAVRTHLPWYWRALSIVLLLATAIALSGWVYDAGRRFAGFDRSETEREIQTLRDQVVQLDGEVAKLRTLANASESNLQIERTAQQQLTRQVKTLEDENTRLKEDLAVFENLAQDQASEGGLTISRFNVTPGAVPGQYRYRLLAAFKGMQKTKEFKGSLQFVVALKQENGSGTSIMIPGADAGEDPRFAVSFRYFRRLEGVFGVPAGTQVRSVEVRLIQGGAVKATQRITL